MGDVGILSLLAFNGEPGGDSNASGMESVLNADLCRSVTDPPALGLFMRDNLGDILRLALLVVFNNGLLPLCGIFDHELDKFGWFVISLTLGGDKMFCGGAGFSGDFM